MTTERILGASTMLNGEPPTEWRLWPIGQVRARWAGGKEATFVFDGKAAESVMADYADVGHDLSVDYNHAQFDRQPRTDADMRSAGSFDLELRDDGLYMVDIRWTDDAAGYIRRREYRYLSPAFDADTKSQRIVRLLNVALTPNPATLGALPLVASRDDASIERGAEGEGPSVEPVMLGLAADASPTDVAVRAVALHNFERHVLDALGAQSREEAGGKLEAIMAKADEADDMQVQLARLNEQFDRQERDALIRQALADRKLTPAQSAEGGFARSVPLETLRAYLADAPQVVPTEAREPNEDTVTTAAEEWDRLDGPQRAWLYQNDRDRYAELRMAKLGR